MTRIHKFSCFKKIYNSDVIIHRMLTINAVQNIQTSKWELYKQTPNQGLTLIPSIRAPDKWIFKDNSGKIFLISQWKRMLCPSLEPFQQDNSDEGSQHIICFHWEIRKIKITCYPFLSEVLYPHLCKLDFSHYDNKR